MYRVLPTPDFFTDPSVTIHKVSDGRGNLMHLCFSKWCCADENFSLSESVQWTASLLAIPEIASSRGAMKDVQLDCNDTHAGLLLKGGVTDPDNMSDTVMACTTLLSHVITKEQTLQVGFVHSGALRLAKSDGTLGFCVMVECV